MSFLFLCTSFLFLASVRIWKIQVDATALIIAETLKILSTFAFAPSGKYQHSQQDKKHFSIIMKIPLHSPLKMSWIPSRVCRSPPESALWGIKLQAQNWPKLPGNYSSVFPHGVAGDSKCAPPLFLTFLAGLSTYKFAAAAALNHLFLP